MNIQRNMTRRSWMAAAAAALVLLAGMPAAWADELGDLKDRFKARAPQLSQLRDAGTVGETHDGWAAMVKPGEDAAAAPAVALLAAENADRKALYALIASKQGVSPEVVAERNALRTFKAAAADHYLRIKGGAWVRKKDIQLTE